VSNPSWQLSLGNGRQVDASYNTEAQGLEKADLAATCWCSWEPVWNVSVRRRWKYASDGTASINFRPNDHTGWSKRV